MKHMYQLIKDNPIGVLSGRFRSRLFFEEIVERVEKSKDGMITEGDIMFESNGVFIGSLKMSEVHEFQEINKEKEKLVLVTGSSDDFEDGIEIKLEFSLNSTGTFTAMDPNVFDAILKKMNI